MNLTNISELPGLLQLERLEKNLFRGNSRDIGSKYVFGGQVLAQGLSAASQTVEEPRLAHSLHGYFILPGDIQAPIVYQVDRTRDGKSFTTRRVTAIQHGKAIFHMAASFQVEEEGLEHQIEMPDVPTPDQLTEVQAAMQQAIDQLPDRLRRVFNRERPVEFCPVEPLNPFQPDKHPAKRNIWIRTNGQLPDDPNMHRNALAYASDFNFITTALLPHGISWLDPKLQIASLDHAMWFHRPFRADEWLLYHIDSPNANGARGLSRGSIYNTDGVLVASVAQEGLMRLRE
ncbi:acyl-CoA thioesterase II [Pontibacter sp. G13]|uniref:acyl-CoA thioesterase II n=1 Tax=Pontibacter sp. G13 TaxID=3074898 RepID=UPI002889D6FA|nr:acyl-CoA thioesterase II [Pontibacter sp. G13]WNJ20611.1 acyl-CoA thioesterase II [Pontibacter sp. G13]